MSSIASCGHSSQFQSRADGSVWVIGADAQPEGYGIYKWSSSGWDQVVGAGVRIAVDPHGNAWVVNRAGEIFEFVAAGWRQHPGAGIDIGVGPDGSAWVVGTVASTSGQGNSVFRWNGADA